MPIRITSLPALLAAGMLVAPLSASAGQDIKIKASGNRPDWQLEIMETGNRIDFTQQGEAASYRYAALGPSLYRDSKTHVYRVLDESHAMSVLVMSNACIDSATGKSHEVTILISFDGEGYRGCGDVLTQLLEP
ncbi:MAG: hypothetical protein WBO34_06635 [Gammaproteobacteria bacterium]